MIDIAARFPARTRAVNEAQAAAFSARQALEDALGRGVRSHDYLVAEVRDQEACAALHDLQDQLLDAIEEDAWAIDFRNGELDDVAPTLQRGGGGISLHSVPGVLIRGGRR